MHTFQLCEKYRYLCLQLERSDEMSRLDELIRELCPNGVEYKTVDDIAIDIYRGNGITRDQVTNEGIPCVRYGEIYTTYGIWFDNCVSHTKEEFVPNGKYFENGDILFAITGESVEEIAKSCAYVGHEKCLAGGDIVVLKHNQDPKYLSYALSSTEARMQKSKGIIQIKNSLYPPDGYIPDLPTKYIIYRQTDLRIYHCRLRGRGRRGERWRGSVG